MAQNRARNRSTDRELTRQRALSPPPHETRIWRYMSLAKFVSLLETRSLYFARADCVTDPFEGSFKHVSADAASVSTERVRAHLHEQYRNDMRFLRKRTFLNCWHRNRGESAAMWGLYAPSGEGIVVESTYGRLRQALKPDVRIGTVRYIDYVERGPDLGFYFSHFLFKRKSFAHEAELRALIQDIPDLPSSELASLLPCEQRGLPISVPLERLVVSIRVPPIAEDWFLDAVAGVMRRYGLEQKPVRSDLDTDPVL